MCRHTNRILAGVAAFMAVTAVAAIAFYLIGNMQNNVTSLGEFSLSQVGYDSVGKYSEKLAPVKIYDQWGYCDSQGTVQIVPKFATAGEFSYELAAVQELEGDLFGYIDKNGKYILEPQFSYAGSFSEELAACGVKSKTMLGYIDKTGEFIIPEKYYEAGNFSEGLAKVRTASDTLYSYIDKNDKVIIPANYTEATDFSEGMAAVSIDGLWGFVDKTGKLVIEPRFSGAHSFHENLAAVELEDSWGYIDRKGNFVINNTFSEAGDFSGGYAPVRFKNSGLWGYITNKGVTVIGGTYLHATSFTEGVAAVEENSKWSFMTNNNYKPLQSEQEDIAVLSESNVGLETSSGGKKQETTGEISDMDFEQQMQLHVNESVQLSGLIKMNKVIEKIVLNVVGEDGEDKGIYLSIKPDAETYNLELVSIDSRIEPFNVPGKYKLLLMIKLEGVMNEIKVGVINVEVLEKQGDGNLTVDIGRVDSSEFPNINLFVSVFNKQNEPVSSLTLDDFKLFESLEDQDELEQELKLVSQPGVEEDGLNVILVFDSSLSMYNNDRTEAGSNMELAKNAAIEFIHSGGFATKDKVAIQSFGKAFTINQDYTDDAEKLVDAITGIEVQSDTAIYDTIIKSVDTITDPQGKNCIILFTDGEDTASKLEFTDSIESAAEKGVPVYSIAIGEAAKTNELKSISDRTGGAFYYLKDPKELNNIYKDITNKLKFQYQLTYTSMAGATAVQSTKIKLVVTNNGDSITTQKIY